MLGHGSDLGPYREVDVNQASLPWFGRRPSHLPQTPNYLVFYQAVALQFGRRSRRLGRTPSIPCEMEPDNTVLSQAKLTLRTQARPEGAE